MSPLLYVLEFMIIWQTLVLILLHAQRTVKNKIVGGNAVYF